MSYPDSTSSEPVIYEPAVAYGASKNRYVELMTILGGGRPLNSKVKNELDLIGLSRIGLPKRTLDSIAYKLNITMERLSQLLHISHRTLQRKAPGDHLSVHISEQILAIAELIRRGTEVLGGERELEVWLHSELPALNDRKPIDLMDTGFGVQMLLRILGRIEHGVY